VTVDSPGMTSRFIVLLVILLLGACRPVSETSVPEIETVEPLTDSIPDYEIVFYATNKVGNVLGFINVSSPQPIYRTIVAPYSMNNDVRWSADGQSIVGRLAPTTNPNAAYPMLITPDGKLHFCEVVGSGYAWGVGGTLVITNDLETKTVILIDMETCSILSVIYHNEGGIGEVLVGPHDQLLVQIPKSFALINYKTADVLSEMTFQGTPVEWSPDGLSILVQDNSIYITSLDDMQRRHVVSGGWASWSPAGTHIIYSGGSIGNSITIKDLATEEETLLFDGGLSPSWRIVP
jgi:hypothetical protein